MCTGAWGRRPCHDEQEVQGQGREALGAVEWPEAGEQWPEGAVAGHEWLQGGYY